ncbi:MAG: AGE family epimerase/isomerase [Promethearchaeota archaeon]
MKRDSKQRTLHARFNILLIVMLILSILFSATTDFHIFEVGEINPNYCIDQEMQLYSKMKNSEFQLVDSVNNELFLPLLRSDSQEDPEVYFPNFLFYSIMLGNALIDYLYDNETSGFYRSTNEYWTPESLLKEKWTYDQAQAIRAFLKLSKALLNESQIEYAIQIATETANYMIQNLWDNESGGFYMNDQGSRYKLPGIQGQAVMALIDLFKVTGNQTFLEIASECLNFMNSNGWDSANGGYYYILSHIGDIATTNPFENIPYEPDSKRVDHNVLMGKALLEYHKVSSDSLLLSKAIDVYQFINSTSRNSTTSLFYTGVDINNETVEPSYADIFIQSQVLDFLAQLYEVTGNSTYYDDFFTLIKNVIYYFWDDQFGAFFATYSYEGIEANDKRKFTERQFYAIRALDEAYKLSNNSAYYNLILNVFEVTNEMLYDNIHEGYYQIATQEGQSINPSIDPSWRYKYTVSQALAIFELANIWLYSKPGVLNALWSPTQPRPQDNVKISVAAFDSDGINNVILNYSLNNEPYKQIEMDPDPNVGNMYYTIFTSQLNGTKMNFNINVNDTFGNIAVRGSYFFLWQQDVWSPHVEQLAIEPAYEVNVHTKVSMTVFAQDIPSQGSIADVYIYYHEQGKTEQVRELISTSGTIWTIEFPDGFGEPHNFVYYFVAIDDQENVGYSAIYSLIIYGEKVVFPLTSVILVLFVVVILVPMGLYVYVERKKKQARRKIKSIRIEKRTLRTSKRGTRRARKRRTEND